MEGIGETLKESGALVDTDMDNLMLKMRTIIRNHDLSAEIEESALNYAHRYSWQNQAYQRYELAGFISEKVPLWEDIETLGNL